MKQISILLLVLLSNILLSQTSDDFEDGNFTENPEWTGNLQLFKVNSAFQLQLNDSIENKVYLGTTNTMINNTEWRCWIKLGFSPSGNNNARYYLVSNKQDLSDSLAGYFLQFGESGSNDAIELFRQDGTELFSVCRSIDGIISSSFEIRVKVTRDGVGLWKLFVDQSGGEDFTFEAEGIDNTFTQTSQLGFLCRYTKSNSNKMYFDDVYAGPFIVDNEPPVLLGITVDTDSTVTLQFNESLNEGSVALINNYEVDNGIGNPTSAFRDDNDASIIRLSFNSKFKLGKNYLMAVSGVKDLVENIMIPQQMNFVYYQPQPMDVVINEIMADPNPSVGLPDYEYLELYNQTETNIDLDNWTLIIGTSEKTFSSININAGSYLIIAKEAAYDELSTYGDFYGFSSFSLTNAGQTIQLKSNNGETISSVTYASNWYNDPVKEEGGWSLEQKYAANICSGKENWTASINNKGGTPATINSVANNTLLLPQLSKLEVLTDNIIQLYFNQSMDEESLSNNDLYNVDNNIGSPEYVYTYYDEPEKVELYFENRFIPGVTYELTISNNLMNCMLLNLSADTLVYFGLPDIVTTNDIVINEILFNPWTNGKDYVELYNPSSKIIDLSTLSIGSIKENPPNPPDTSIYNIVSSQSLFMPDEYMVLTMSPEAVMKQYTIKDPNAFLKVDPFPSYNNDEGHVFLISNDDIIIDSLSYSEDMQFPLLVYFEGVALERIVPNMSINGINNWHSAAENAGFGTPGYKNSQHVSNNKKVDEIIIEPEIFSPNNDGFEDIISILYEFDKPGYVMSATIFNAEGYSIKKLTNNEYLGSEGSISWDGIQDDNSKAPVGIYVFFITIYDAEGKVKNYKKTGVLATKL
ncbi:MAG TPA: lamin tail domain-containing protein [Bacteroidales bacterium]|jgi:hypothetical protein|nr:lamin tail domain-containing protein [Bacteroidales bacterium]